MWYEALSTIGWIYVGVVIGGTAGYVESGSAYDAVGEGHGTGVTPSKAITRSWFSRKP